VGEKVMEPEIICNKCGSHLIIVNTSNEDDNTRDYLFFTCGMCGFHGDWGHFHWAQESQNQIRPEIMRFAEIMETKMAQNDEWKGDSWKDLHYKDIHERIEDEWKEYLEAEHKELKEYMQDELIDIANFCMMGWNNMERKPEPKPPTRY
jgi:hypothetical protein